MRAGSRFDLRFVRRGGWLTALALLVFGLAGCGPGGRATPEVIYRPVAATPVVVEPTVAPPTPSPAPPQPTPTPGCTSSLRYLEDLTLPDGSPVSPGETLDKRWQVENDGACNWDKAYRLRPVAGPLLGAPAELALYPARAGTAATIRILFTAPAEPGSYRSAWQAHDPQGQPFGDPFFIDILVTQ